MKVISALFALATLALSSLFASAALAAPATATQQYKAVTLKCNSPDAYAVGQNCTSDETNGLMCQGATLMPAPLKMGQLKCPDLKGEISQNSTTDKCSIGGYSLSDCKVVFIKK
ncbi:hypothetical protein [Candidiatus Paracoxiella cheracis]|uniref:hypothetical protein n=1 Tax=Candidiatus Paracoxiella cheracis TaxID=3405120 RepID=UPI003BF5BDD2